MKKLALILALTLLPLPAYALDQTQRIATTIGNLVIEGAGLAAQVDQLQAEVKRLKDKYEPETLN